MLALAKAHAKGGNSDIRERSINAYEIGVHVRALAPYGSQVKALAELGTKANTVASFLKSKERDIDANTLLIIDEAGVIPARQMAELLKIVEAANARVVLLGDVAQTKAIEAGRPFDQLQANKMQMAIMEDIQRQKIRN